MEIVQRSPFEVRTLVWEAQPSQWSLSICVKATYRLLHGGEAELAEPIAPTEKDTHWDDDPAQSLRVAADLVPYKPRADILLVGHACAPSDAPVTSLVVRFRVGDFEKAIRVSGDRVWRRDGAELVPSKAAPFTRIPLRFELAERSSINPAGIDPSSKPIESRPALPNLEPAGGALTASFGPLSPDWPARGGRLDDEHRRWADALIAGEADGPQPSGFDFSFFNAAPPEQQVDMLRANAAIVLENLHPAHPLLATRLPAQRPKSHRIDANGRFHDIPLRCDTLFIDADNLLATVCFRGLTDLGGDRLEAGHVVVDLERSSPAAELGAGGAPSNGPHPLAMRHDSVRGSRGAAGLGVTDDGEASTQRIGLRDAEDEATLSRTHELPPGKQAARTLPFAGKRLPPPPPPKEVASSDTPESTEDELTPDRAPAPLPFAPKVGTPKPPPLPKREPSAPTSGETMEIDIEQVELALLAATPFEGRLAVSSEAGELGVEETGTEAPTPELSATLPLARCARIAAELRYGRGRDEVLSEENVSHATWRAALSHWERARRDEAERGESSLTDKFDQSYVELFERLTRTLGPDDYAELVVETERGGGAAAARALGLDPQDLSRVLGTLSRRLAAAPDALTTARAEIEKRREQP